MINIEIGETDWGNSAVVVRRQWDFISHNNNCYWIHLDEFDIEVRIAKQSPEGELLTKAIKDGDSDEILRSLILKFCLPKIHPKMFLYIVQENYKKGFRDGRNSMREDFAELMLRE